MTKVLFICTGNINRSPAAEIILRSKLPAQGFEVDSAATSPKAGNKLISTKMRAALDGAGYSYEPTRSKIVTQSLVDWADIIFCMSPVHKRRLQERRLSDFDHKVQCLGVFMGLEIIHDPHFDSTGVMHHQAVKVIENCCSALANQLISVCAE